MLNLVPRIGATAVTSCVAWCDKKLERKLTPIGKFSLLSETRENPSITGVLVEVKGRLSKEVLSRVIQERVLVHSRFRSRITDLAFVEVPGFQASQNIFEEKEPVANWLAERLTAPLPQPPWEIRLHHDRDRTFFLMRAHHCLADGVSMASLLGQCTDQAHELRRIVDSEIKKRRWFLFLVGFFIQFLTVLFQTLRALLLPRPFGPPVGGFRRRHVAWKSAFASVDDLRLIAQKLGPATINDVFAALVAAALRTECPGHSKVAVAVPVHLYGGALPTGTDIGNAIGAVFCPLPLDNADDPARHLRDVSAHVGTTLRGGVGPLLAYVAALAVATFVPHDALPSLFGHVASNAAAAFSNIRGPPLALSIAGHPLLTVPVPFLPPPPGIPVGVALVTVDGQATLSVNADPRVLDADRFLANALAHYDRLARLALVRGSDESNPLLLEASPA